MSLSFQGSRASSLFEVQGSASGLLVVGFSAHEGISSLFTIRVALAAETEIKTFDEIVGKHSLLTVINNDKAAGGDRYFHGMVRRFEHTGMSGRNYLYEAEVVPSVYFLSLRRNCRIFQETTTQEIVKTLLEESGIDSSRYRFALENTDRKRGFCVQYQESDLDFISRLMEEEGICYFFEHYKDKHVLVMSDSMSVHVPINGKPSITCNPGDGLVADKESVSHFTFSQRRTSEAFVHGNFFFKKPGLNLTRKNTEAEQTRYEIYDYAALHTTQAHGDILAKARMEQLVALQKQGHGQSSSCRLTPGYKVTLTDHDSQSLNAEYLIIDVTHAGSQPQTLEEKAGGSATYGNQFTVIPAKTQFRPDMRTPKPLVKGLQSAIVVGPENEEIFTDQHGRVKVQFHWDREGKWNEGSSCWLRVSQLWGGVDWGSQFIPRIGDEVLVDFLEGNPDRPLITGSVYNGDNIPINPLTRSITQSGIRTRTHKGAGFNELRFDDAKDAEEIYLQGEKDWNILVKNEKRQKVGHDEQRYVDNNRGKTVGANQTETVGRNHTETIGANKSEHVYINKAETIGVAKELTIGGLYQVTVGGAMNQTVVASKTEEVGAAKVVMVGAHMLEKVAGDRTIDTGTTHKIQAGQLFVTGADEIIFKTGKAMISMKRSGEMQIIGGQVTAKATGAVRINGMKVSKLGPEGIVIPDDQPTKQNYSLKFDFSKMHESGIYYDINHINMPVEIAKPDGTHITTLMINEYGITRRFYTEKQEEIVAWAGAGDWGVIEEFELIGYDDEGEDEEAEEEFEDV
jgi:type VI secretion system secreted protein VgrG